MAGWFACVGACVDGETEGAVDCDVSGGVKAL